MNFIKKQGFILFALFLAAIFVYLQYDKIDLEKTSKAIKNAHYIWLIISMALGILAYWFRALRWNLLFEPLGIQINKATAFWIIAFFYFLNIIIPRSGEIARATALYKVEKVPVQISLGTIVTERIVDLFFLMLFGVLTLLFNTETLFAFIELAGRQKTESTSYLPYFIFFSIILIVALLIFLFRENIQKSKIYQKLKDMIKGFKEGLLSIFKMKQNKLFIFYSCGIWICYFLMTYLVVFAFDATSNLSFQYGFFLMIAGSIGMILPATGGLAYPYIMRFAFGAIFLSLGDTLEKGFEVGSYFGISLYLAQLLSIFIFGIISVIYITKKKKYNDLTT